MINDESYIPRSIRDWIYIKIKLYIIYKFSDNNHFPNYRSILTKLLILKIGDFCEFYKVHLTWNAANNYVSIIYLLNTIHLWK